jgi:hypothetical protein
MKQIVLTNLWFHFMHESFFTSYKSDDNFIFLINYMIGFCLKF